MEKNTSGQAPRPSVGLGVMVVNEHGKFLMGLRKGSHGGGEWGLPGGHIEFGETIFETAHREVKEETDLDVVPERLISVADVFDHIEKEGRHYIAFGVLAKYQGGEPKLMEPEKCEEWRWFDSKNLPENIIAGSRYTLRNYRRNELYIAAEK